MEELRLSQSIPSHPCLQMHSKLPEQNPLRQPGVVMHWSQKRPVLNNVILKDFLIDHISILPTIQFHMYM